MFSLSFNTTLTFNHNKSTIMNGLDLRKKLELTKMSLAEIARLADINPQSLIQSLSTKDIKTGLVEKLASALHLPLSYFYGEDAGTHAIATGNKAVAAVNSTIADNSQNVQVLEERVRSLESLVQEKERLIKVYERFLEDKGKEQPR